MSSLISTTFTDTNAEALLDDTNLGLGFAGLDKIGTILRAMKTESAKSLQGLQGAGGISVADRTALAAITVADIADTLTALGSTVPFLVVTVLDDGDGLPMQWRWDPTSTATASTNVVRPGSNPTAGRWFRYLDQAVYTSSSNPAATDDGYPLGSLWLNTTRRQLFMCVANGDTAAVWRTISPNYTRYTPDTSEDIISGNTAGAQSGVAFATKHTCIGNPAVGTRIRGRAVVKTTAAASTDELALAFQIAGVTVVSLPSSDATTGDLALFEFDVVVAVTGASAVLNGHKSASFNTTTVRQAVLDLAPNLSSAFDITVKATWNTNSSSDTAALRLLEVEITAS